MSDQTDQPARLARERRTIRAMIMLYCEAHHADARADDAWLCDECSALLDYALKRLECCPFGAEKPTCAKCPVHCYKPSMRERVRQVMRWSGPRMMLRHPWLAARHLIDGAVGRERADTNNQRRQPREERDHGF